MHRFLKRSLELSTSGSEKRKIDCTAMKILNMIFPLLPINCSVLFAKHLVKRKYEAIKPTSMFKW